MTLDALIRDLPEQIAWQMRQYRAEPGGSTLAEVYRVQRDQLLITLADAHALDDYGVLLFNLHRRLADKRAELTRVIGREPHLAAMIEAAIETLAALIVRAEALDETSDAGGGYLPIR